MVDFLTDVIIKVLFGPWFYLVDYVPAIQTINILPKQLFVMVVVILPIAVALRIRRLKKEKFVSRSEKIFSRVFYSCLWLFLVGVLANSGVMVANSSRMPTFAKNHNSAYLKNPDRVIDKLHVLADGKTKLLWLSDYIDPDSSTIADFFYPYSYSSPGDFSLAAAFVIGWWLLVAILSLWILNGVRAISKRSGGVS